MGNIHASNLDKQKQSVHITSGCDFCGNPEAVLIHILNDHRLEIPGNFELLECQTCKLLYIYPQPVWEDLIKHYPINYHSYTRETNGKFLRVLRNYGLQRRIAAITKRKPDGKSLLDVGCATGLFLKEFKEYTGWSVTGIEPIPAAADYAMEHYGLNIIIGNLLDVELNPLSFDVITLWDVLEHTPHPSKHLAKIYNLLTPGGLLVIKAPDPSAKEAKVFGKNWIGYEAPQHLFGFPKMVLISKLEMTGFVNIETAQIGSDFASFFTSLGIYLENSGIKNFGRVMKSYPKSTLGRLTAPLIVTPLRWMNFKSSVTYFATKPTQED